MKWVIEYYNGASWVPLRAQLQQIEENLSDHEEALFYLANTAANRAIVASNVDTQFSFDGTVIFTGELSALEYTDIKILCICYNKVYEAMKRKTVTGNYFEIAANTILAAICTAAGVTAGTCPVTQVSVRFERCDCYSAAVYLAKTLTTDCYATLGTTFNIGARGSAKAFDDTKIAVSNRGLDRSKLRDKVYIRGVDENGVRVYGEAGAGTNVGVYNDKKASDQATLNALAATKLAEMNTSDSGISVSTKITNAALLYPGDTVSITKTRLNLSGTYRIKRISKESTNATIDLNTPKKLIEDLLNNIASDSEELGIYPLINEQLDNPPGAPAAPTGLAATAELSGVRLTWTSNIEADLDRYVIYRNTTPTATTEYIRVDSNNVLDKNITYGVTYYYRLKAKDRAGNLSDYSSEASAAPKKIVGVDITDAAIVAAALQKGIQPFNSDIVFSPYVGAETNKLSWAAGTIKYADGTTLAIDAGSSGTLTAGTFYYVYFVAGSATLTITSTYSDAVGDTKGLLATVGCSSTAGSNLLIQPFAAKGLNINADVIAGNVAILNKIWADTVTGKTLQTASSGTRVVLNSTGIHIYGEILKFYDTAGTYRGVVVGYDNSGESCVSVLGLDKAQIAANEQNGTNILGGYSSQTTQIMGETEVYGNLKIHTDYTYKSADGSSGVSGTIPFVFGQSIVVKNGLIVG